MSKPRGALLLVLFVSLFWIANRPAHKGYFSDDDLDTLSWAIHSTPSDFARGLLSPKFAASNFRPAGHFFYHQLGTTVGLDFPRYVGVLQALHVVNVWLMWLLLRRLGASVQGALAGAALFAFHLACFDAYWKPMYVFDVLAGTFVLLSLLLYMGSRW